MAKTFAGWRDGVLDSYLVDITAEILATRTEGGEWVIDLILDAAGQKGTGKWTVIEAMNLGQPVTLVAEAVGARIVSSFVEEREKASQILVGPNGAPDQSSVDAATLEQAIYAAKIISYAQGFMLLGAASEEQEWSLDLGAVAGLWREGCIIRAAFLRDIMNAFENAPGLQNLLFDPFFTDAVNAAQGSLRKVVSAAAVAGVAMPAMASALAFFDGYRSRRTSANLIQAQRDYFGAHTYERVDRPRGEFFHTDWAGTGGDATAGSYSA